MNKKCASNVTYDMRGQAKYGGESEEFRRDFSFKFERKKDLRFEKFANILIR